MKRHQEIKYNLDAILIDPYFANNVSTASTDILDTHLYNFQSIDIAFNAGRSNTHQTWRKVKHYNRDYFEIQTVILLI